MELSPGLVVAAGVYVGFAVLAADGWAALRAFGGVVIFAAPAWLGLRRGMAWLAAGWAAHVVWDVGLHLVTPAVAPGWYALLCVGFDPVVAGAALAGERGAEGVTS